MGMRLAVNGLLSIVLAPSCAACGRPLDTPADGAVCRICWHSVRTLTPPFCGTCGEPLMSHGASLRTGCARCRSHAGLITASRSIGEYDGSLRAIVHALKYGRRQSVAARLGVLMRQHGRAVLTGADCVAPVPLHWRREWKRGFNQAAALAAGLELRVEHALRRRRNTASQTDLPAAQRRANVRNAFRLRRGAAVASRCIVLVDDVSTTGATLEACARILLDGGAREVRALTAARVSTR